MKTALHLTKQDDLAIDVKGAGLKGDQLVCEKQLEIVEGATHLFEEPGALERVSDLAANWFEERLAVARAAQVRTR